MKIQDKRFYFSSPFGPHLLVYLLDRLKGKPLGYARYKWNLWGQCVGVFSTCTMTFQEAMRAGCEKTPSSPVDCTDNRAVG